MIAFDTDLFSELLAGADEYSRRVEKLPPDRLCITVITVEEVLRGLLDVVRKAQAGKGRHRPEVAYERLRKTVGVIGRWVVLPYSSEAHTQLEAWRASRLPVKPQDRRVAAICMAAGATLITRNRRDFERVPGLDVEFWP